MLCVLVYFKFTFLFSDSRRGISQRPTILLVRQKHLILIDEIPCFVDYTRDAGYMTDASVAVASTVTITTIALHDFLVT
jgi:hypothetical protein